MARVYKTFFFEIKIGIQTVWGQGAPSFRNKIAEMCYLYRRTGQRSHQTPWGSCLFSSKSYAKQLLALTSARRLLCLQKGMCLRRERLQLWRTSVFALTPLGPQSRLGTKLLKFQVVCPRNETAVLKGVG